MEHDEILLKLETFDSDIEVLEGAISADIHFINDIENEKPNYVQQLKEAVKEKKEELKKMKIANKEILENLNKFPGAAPHGFNDCLRCGSMYQLDKEFLFKKKYYVKTYNKLGQQMYNGKEFTIWKCKRCGAQMFYGKRL
ncbi:MAG: hypothetical protein ACFFAH_01995 [Promethearchaeota archaeon]